MGERIAEVVAKIQHSPFYPPLFYAAYGDTIVTGERVLKALSQFQLTFISANSKYDKVKRREQGISFTPQETNGYELFKKNCAACHTEPMFTSGEFANNGLPVDSLLNDKGRFLISQDAADLQKFKIPTLRNIEYSYPYMHDGRFKKLSQVLDHYIHGIEKSGNLAKELETKIELTANEKVDLIAFLLSLSDREFVMNPAFGYPKK